MGKVKLPDDINDWEKRSLREDIGTSEEHKHTIYVYKDFAIEHEEDECCNNWNPYVIVNGHPLKLHEGYFHNFDEALGYLKGAIKEKELVDFDNSPDEPEFPKAKTEDMHKGIQLPTAREMFAEAHCLPDADALRQSYKEHRSQMYDMLFNARKATLDDFTEKDAEETEEAVDPDNLPENPKSPGTDISKTRVNKTKDRSWHSPSGHYQPGRLVAKKIDRNSVDALKNVLTEEESESRAGAKQDVRDLRAQEVAEGGKAVTKMPEFKGLSTVGTFNYGGKSYPTISSGSNYGRMFFSKAPGEGGKRKGIWAAIDAHNAMIDNADKNDVRVVNGLLRKYDDNVGNLSPAQVRSLFVNNYYMKDPQTGAFTLRPSFSEQLDYLGGIDLTQDIFNPDGSLNGRAWSAIQRGDVSEPQSNWTPIKWSTVGQNMGKPMDYLHISGEYGWDPHDQLYSTDMNQVSKRFDEIRNDPKLVKRFLNSQVSMNQLNELKKRVPGQILNKMMGYTFNNAGPQTDVTEFKDLDVPVEQQIHQDYGMDKFDEAEAKQAEKYRKLMGQVESLSKILEDEEDPRYLEAFADLEKIVHKDPEFVVNNSDLFDEGFVDMAKQELQGRVHDFTAEQARRTTQGLMSADEIRSRVQEGGMDRYTDTGTGRKNAVNLNADAYNNLMAEDYKMRAMDDDQKYASMRGENMDDVMKAKAKQDENQKGLGDFKDTPESEMKERAPLKPKEEPKIADITGYKDDPDAKPPEPKVAPKRHRVDLSGPLVWRKPLDSDIKWSDNPTAPTTQVSFDEVEERPPARPPAPEPEDPYTQLSLDQGWTSTAPQFDPLARIKDYGVNMFGSMQLQDWYKALMATDPTSPEYANQLKALQFRVGFDPNISELERATYGPLLKRAEANMGIPAFKSFREEMEKSISDKDAAAGIPTGFMGTHPMTSPYKRVELGYGKDATYPFVLRNALTGEKVCDVTDNPRENSD